MSERTNIFPRKKVDGVTSPICIYRYANLVYNLQMGFKLRTTSLLKERKLIKTKSVLNKLNKYLSILRNIIKGLDRSSYSSAP